MFRFLRSPAGEHLWFDLTLLFLCLLVVMFLVVYAVRKYRLHFPPFRPLALIGLAYWFTGMAFSSLHQLVWYFNRDAYTGLKDHTNFEFVYYSFVALTTLGYGDIYPVSYAARWLSIVEACIGIFFVAVLIAILIGNKPKHH